MVALVQGSIYGPSASGQYCSMGYSIELFVDPTNLASYGVRNFQTFTRTGAVRPIARRQTLREPGAPGAGFRRRSTD